MTTITVKQFVMLLTAQTILEAARHTTPDTLSGDKTPYDICGPIVPIICKDGTKISVQAHGGVHCQYTNIAQTTFGYSVSFGESLLKAEVNGADFDTDKSYNIRVIEDYVNSHGGIDIESSTNRAIQLALDKIKIYCI